MPQFSNYLVAVKFGNQAQQSKAFWADEDDSLFDPSSLEPNQILNRLVFAVCRHPNNLLAHLRRIHLCYQQQWSGPLYGALLDFLIVLQNRGQALSRRIVGGCRSGLAQEDFLTLTSATAAERMRLSNGYSMFSTGVMGRSELVRQNRKDHSRVDALVLANDFIEYSQLEQAMDVLEAAVHADPGREDLQSTLLQLYKSTADRRRFQAFYDQLLRSGLALSANWHDTADCFAGRTP